MQNMGLCWLHAVREDPFRTPSHGRFKAGRNGEHETDKKDNLITLLVYSHKATTGNPHS